MTIALIVLLALLAGAILSAGHWLPRAAALAAERWDMGLEIGGVDLFPLHRAEVRDVTLFDKSPASHPDSPPVATVGHIKINYQSLGELFHKHINSISIHDAMVDETELMNLIQNITGAAPTRPMGSPLPWAEWSDMLSEFMPDRVELQDISLTRPGGDRFTLAKALVDKEPAPGNAVRLFVTMMTAPLDGMIPYPIESPLAISAEFEISPNGLLIDQLDFHAGPLLRFTGQTQEPVSRLDRLAVKLTSLDWDWELAHELLGLEPMGVLRFKPRDLTLQFSIGAPAPDWAGDFPASGPVAEVHFPASPIAWSDIATGRSIEGALAANVQAAFDPATGRIRAAVLTRGNVNNLIIPGRRIHDASATIIGTVDWNLGERAGGWDVSIQANAPLDAVEMLEDWRAGLSGRMRGRLALGTEMNSRSEFDLTASLIPAEGEALQLPLTGEVDWAMNDNATSHAIAGWLNTTLDGASLHANIEGVWATSPTLSLRADWSNFDLAAALRRAERFIPPLEFAAMGGTAGAATVVMPADGLIETSATLHLENAMLEWPRGEPLLTASISLTAAMRGRGLPWEADRGAQFHLHATDDNHFDVELAEITPLGGGLMAWSAASTSRLDDAAWLLALMSLSPPFDLSGAVEQSGQWRAEMKGESIAFEYEGLAAVSEFSIKPPDPDPLFQVDYLTTEFDLATSGVISPTAMDIGFRFAPADIEINQLIAPHLDWAFFEASASGQGRTVLTALAGDPASTRTLSLDLDRFEVELPDMARLNGSFTGGAQMGDAGLAHPWGELNFSAEVSDATSLGWQLSVWQGDGDISGSLNPARASLADGILEFDGRFEMESPFGEAPYAYVIWEDLTAAGTITARVNPALDEFHVRTQGKAEMGEAAGGGATARKLAARWSADLPMTRGTLGTSANREIDVPRTGMPNARVTLDSARLYGGFAWATATIDGWPAAPILRAEGELRDFDLDDFTTNYKTGDITMQGLMNVDWAVSWDFHNPAEYHAGMQAASDVVTVDKGSVKWLLDQAFGGTANPLGFLSPARTLDRKYSEGRRDAIMHHGRVMIPFTQFEATSRFQGGIFRNQIDLKNQYFSIDFQPNVQAPVVLEFLEIAQSDMGN